MLLHGKPRHATLFLSIFKKPKELGRRKHLALFFMSELRITLENFEKIRHVKHPSLNCLFLSDFRIWKREDIIFHFSSWICLFLLCLWSLPSAISFSNNVWNLLPFSPALPCQNSWSTAPLSSRDVSIDVNHEIKANIFQSCSTLANWLWRTGRWN